MSALIGKAGESLVAAELLRRLVNVAVPAYDGGVDLIAYREMDMRHVVPIQVKARSATCYNFQRAWFDVPGIVLVQVWHTATHPEFYIFGGLSDVEAALGPAHSASASWIEKGGYNVTTPGPDATERMRPHKDRWERIIQRLA